MQLRSSNIQKLEEENKVYDVLVLGGGINGAVSAASLSAKGASVALIDKGDFAGLTSSNSSNLAWGGIKYLESHEYLLVNKLCKSRNHLMQSFPSSVKEIRFLTTISKGFRFPAWFVYLGTLFYWVIGRFFTQMPEYIRVKDLPKREPAINHENAVGAFEYSDAYLYDLDARFVFNFIRSSMDYGCIAANYVESLGSVREDGIWVTRSRDVISGEEFTIKSKVLINACGPYVDEHNELNNQDTDHRHLFSKGIHLIVDKVSTEKRVLAFFASDGRLFFVIPLGNKTSIGTTDTQVEYPEVTVTKSDREFVLKNANLMLNFTKPLTEGDIISERCGVRPLAQKDGDGIADWVKLSRKHAVDVSMNDKYVSIFGGKTTDCINVGDEISEIVKGLGIELSASDYKWYGEDDLVVRDDFYHQAKLMNLDELAAEDALESLTQRFWRRYGGGALDLLNKIRQDPSQAERLMEHAEYLRCEIEHIASTEMVTLLEDFLRRRSKISQVVRKEDFINDPGLLEVCRILFSDDADEKLKAYISDHCNAKPDCNLDSDKLRVNQ